MEICQHKKAKAPQRQIQKVHKLVPHKRKENLAAKDFAHQKWKRITPNTGALAGA